MSYDIYKQDRSPPRGRAVARSTETARRTQEDLMEAESSFENLKKELEAVISIVSHDLRAPLVNISGFSEILKDECETIRRVLASETLSADAREKLDDILEQSVPEALEIIDISAKAMNALIRSLVKVARARLVVPKPEVIDMTALIREIVAANNNGLRDAAIHIQDLPPCLADRAQIAQVFTHLIDNSLKYRHPTRRGHICIEGAAKDDHVLYWISDNGIGMDPEHEQQVFDIFFRVDEETITGEGIGLAIAKRMVERNGGRVWLVSEKGEGSNVFVALPAPRDLHKPASNAAHR
ncbi:MAG: HAMP domain-containing histidine kinase [Phycisphaerae bacterium]|nr:HAMP domain-containing histidine kinase [Phycisphaerae bacterium]